MKYKEIYDEYTTLLSQWDAYLKISAPLKEGYISTKTISGKKYSYLQKMVDGKLNSEYIKADMLQQVQAQLQQRKEAKEEISHINNQLSRLETAAKILDKSLFHKLIILKRCFLMDSVSVDIRKKSLDFGNAMAAIEGIPASDDTEQTLALWVDKLCSFKDGYMRVLARHNLHDSWEAI